MKFAIPAWRAEKAADREHLTALVVQRGREAQEDVAAARALAEAQHKALRETIGDRVERVTGEIARLVDRSERQQAGAPRLAVDDLPVGDATRWEPHRRSDVAFLQYTSGSTGTPKGVMLNHSNLMHNSAMITYAFEHSRSGSGCFWLPLYHDMGLIGGILTAMYMGGRTVLMSPTSFLQRPMRWLQAIADYKGIISGAPNFASATGPSSTSEVMAPVSQARLRRRGG